MNNIPKLATASGDELCDHWQSLFKKQPPKGVSQTLMRRILIYELQCQQYGGLDKQTQKALNIKTKSETLANAARKPAAHKLKSGSTLMREWNGITHKVEVIDMDYRWQGREYKSLSAIAKAITGAHWSGPRFFGLNKAGGANG